MSRYNGIISGILSLAAAEQKASSICYRDIPNYPFYHIDGHEGKLYFGKQGNTDVMVFFWTDPLISGLLTRRGFNFCLVTCDYTHSCPQYKTVFPVRLMKLLGVKQIIITNVAGAINTQYEVC